MPVSRGVFFQWWHGVFLLEFFHALFDLAHVFFEFFRKLRVVEDVIEPGYRGATFDFHFHLAIAIVLWRIAFVWVVIFRSVVVGLGVFFQHDFFGAAFAFAQDFEIDGFADLVFVEFGAQIFGCRERRLVEFQQDVVDTKSGFAGGAIRGEHLDDDALVVFEVELIAQGGGSGDDFDSEPWALFFVGWFGLRFFIGRGRFPSFADDVSLGIGDFRDGFFDAVADGGGFFDGARAVRSDGLFLHEGIVAFGFCFRMGMGFGLFFAAGLGRCHHQRGAKEQSGVGYGVELVFHMRCDCGLIKGDRRIDEFVTCEDEADPQGAI